MDGCNIFQNMVQKTKIVKKPQNNIVYIVVFGIIAAITLQSSILFIRHLIYQKNQNTKIQKTPSITPYYENTVFEKPSILIATQSALIKHPIKIPIIMYHYVEDIKDPGDTVRKKLNITPSQFEKQPISLKKNNYETYFVKDIPDIINGLVDYSTQSAVLTFDDGYKDFYSNAFPLLKKYHMRGTIYIIQNDIGKPEFLSHRQIQEMLDSLLIEVGSHTLTHAYLKTMSDNAAKKQIVESKKKLEEEFNIKVETFAYPNGAFNQKTVELVKEASYSAAVSVISGTIQSQENLFFLSRIRQGL